MTINRRGCFRALAGVLVFAAIPALPAIAAEDFTLVTPAVRTEESAKIEVIEFFSYGCPHCSDFSPTFHAWAAKQPADVVVKKIPVTFGRPAWTQLAKIYYALEITGDLERLDADVFKALHEERINLFDEKTATDWVAKKGVNPKKFTEALNSFGLMTRIKRSDQLTQEYKPPSVPAMAVQGRYLISDKSPGDMLSIADRLIAKSRGEKPRK